MLAVPDYRVNAGGSTVFTDDFNRANENLEASSDWERTVGSAGDLAISTNRVVSQSSGSTAYRCVGASLADDQYCQALITGGTSGTSGPGVCVRYSASASTFYHFRWTESGGSFYALFKSVGGSLTSLATSATGQPTPSADLFRLEVSGTSLTCKVNGSTVITHTDSSISSGPHGGVRSFQINNEFEDFEMGDL